MSIIGDLLFDESGHESIDYKIALRIVRYPWIREMDENP